MDATTQEPLERDVWVTLLLILALFVTVLLLANLIGAVNVVG